MIYRSRMYRLTRPYLFEEARRDFSAVAGWTVVQPSMASICQADMRYYTGRRRPEALAKKLPMALLHEGVGHIVEDPSEKYNPGDRVVIIPNIPGYVHSPEKFTDPHHCCSACAAGGPGGNYCEKVLFLGRGVDGARQFGMGLDCLGRNRDIRSVLRCALGHRQANAAAGTGDEKGLATKVVHSGIILVWRPPALSCRS